MKLETRSFGFTKDETEVFEYILTNNNGLSVHLLNIGCAIRKILVPDRNGALKNIVLGYDDTAGYESNSPYLGVVVGRYAGRISDARFSINDIKYTLPRNDGNNCLHGGIKGLSKIVWKTKSLAVYENEIKLIFSYFSKDGEEGFPGNVDFEVTYTLNNKNELGIGYFAVTDKPTIINMTNHSYFNLNGDLDMDVSDHTLKLDSDSFISGDENTLGVMESPVEGTVFDFRSTKKLSAGFNSQDPQIKFFGGYDHAFRINDAKLENVFAKLRSENTGIEMNVRTECMAVILYTSNFMDDTLILCDGKKSKVHLGVCLETQYFPNDINADFVPTKTIINPGEKYSQKTIYSFSVTD